jgi:hypothetical protein
MNKIKEGDILFIVGTMLETRLALLIVQEFIEKKLPIVEINP